MDPVEIYLDDDSSETGSDQGSEESSDEEDSLDQEGENSQEATEDNGEQGAGGIQGEAQLESLYTIREGEDEDPPALSPEMLLARRRSSVVQVLYV
jgi:hypothetical protein